MTQLGQQHGLSIIHVYVLSSWDFISLITILVLIQQVNDLGIFIFWLFNNITKMLQKLSKLHLSSWPKKNLELTGIFFFNRNSKDVFSRWKCFSWTVWKLSSEVISCFFQLRIFLWPLINFQLSLRHFKNQSCPKKDMVGDE
jgi:hypothetical protein